jgi:hypothetical protein
MNPEKRFANLRTLFRVKKEFDYVTQGSRFASNPGLN